MTSQLIPKLFRVVASFFAAAFLIVLASQAAFAEDEFHCNGAIQGGTDSDFNVNIGAISFNQGGLQDLSILGLEDGLAPGDEHLAACSDAEDDAVVLGKDEHVLRGYAWGENVGFVSMYCQGGENQSADCGDYDYFVKVGADSNMYGYAWNATLGYINFQCQGGLDGVGNACGGIDYGVKRDPLTGDLSGYAWSEAGLWIDMDGVTVGLPGEVIAEGDNYCDGKPYVCIQVTPDEEEFDFSIDPIPEEVVEGKGEEAQLLAERAYRVADGVDGYRFHIYLREADGKTPMNPADYQFDEFLGSVTFHWKDTVKIDQLAGNEADDDLGENSTPWANAAGGVVWKPVTLDLQRDFKQDDKDPSHFVSIKKLTSLAPTTHGNLSFTKQGWLFSNEVFLSPLGEDFRNPWTDEIEPNELILERITFDLRTSDGDRINLLSPGVTYANGERQGLKFPFRAPIDFDTLLANDDQDIIEAYRDIPVAFKVGAKEVGVLTKRDDFDEDTLDIDLNLDYSVSDTIFSLECGGDVVRNFLFQFLIDDRGNNLQDEEVTNLSLSELEYLKTDRSLQAVATLPSLEEGQLPCGVAQGPTLYSEISYEVDGTEISYYGNKLPRGVEEAISNPSVWVEGLVFADAFTPNAEIEFQSTGNVAVNVVRDTINENIRRYVGDTDDVETGGECVIEDLVSVVDFDVDGCDADHYKTVAVGEGNTLDNVIYFKESDVKLELDGDWTGRERWVVIVDGGNVYVDENIYTESPGPIGVVAFRSFGQEYGEGGNVYIKNTVTNVDMNVVADGSIFSYEDADDIDSETGEPEWGNFSNLLAALSQRQLVFRGSISSNNTIGGSSLKDYLLTGTREILEPPFDTEERIKAQLYDLNTLRLFGLDVETDENNRPIDQRCGKGLTPEEMLDIARAGSGLRATVAVCNPENLHPCPVGERLRNHPLACDGITPKQFDPMSRNRDGDLMSPEDEGRLALGLEEDVQFNSPVFVIFVAPPEDSFAFSKSESVR